MVMRLPRSWMRLRDEDERSSRRRHRMLEKVRRRAAAARPVDPVESAEVAGLRYVNDQGAPGIRRVGSKDRFRYLRPDGRSVTKPLELQRIRALAIPPAWTDVWICPVASGHLQATGRDARGRKQYRYHPKWRQVRDEVKFGRLIAFAQSLPIIRARTSADLERPGLTRDKVLAAVVQLLEKTLIRVGNEEYARANNSIGLTTMRDEHARVNGHAVRFEFRGKSGIGHAIDLRDRRLARIVKACRDLPGQELFQYLDDRGRRQSVGSADVNAYLREITGQDFTAKDFRTWAGTVLAAKALAGARDPGAHPTNARIKREIDLAIQSVASCLGNTKAVCRKCYIHPAVLDSYMAGDTIRAVRNRRARSTRAGRLDDVESAVVAVIARQLRRRTSAQPASRSAA
jgi:DNA topoisomerase-1